MTNDTTNDITHDAPNDTTHEGANQAAEGEKALSVAVLGAGNIGRPLGCHWTAAGHTVTFGSRAPERLAAFTDPLGERATATTHAEAVAASDIVLLAVPHPALGELLDGLGDLLAGKVVVDATSPIGVGADGLFVSELGPGTTQGSWLAERLPGTAVARAFTHFPDELLWSRGTAQRHFWGMGTAYDDPRAGRAVERLVLDAGFVPVRIGGLATPELDPGGVLFGYVSTPAGLRAAAARG
ncbi:NADPH-dependent F420 reductase [Streptomyces sp. NPDC058486]|uniref:NADPH-dependent F420 reductase n=1 Tax=unclassified Streptomyces TaxID=2593676 RepID=UPI0036507D33